MKILAAALLMLITFAAEAGPRDVGEIYRFRKLQPCPVNGRVQGACPGWHVDHVVPLKCGGADHRSNMQWLTKRAHKLKTKREARLCRKGRRSDELGRIQTMRRRDAWRDR